MMAGEYQLLRPVKAKNKTWLEQNILEFHIESAAEIAWNQLTYSDNEEELDFFPIYESFKGLKDVDDQRLWGPQADQTGIKLQKAHHFHQIYGDYKYNFKKTPLCESFVKRLFISRRYYAAVQDYLEEQRDQFPSEAVADTNYGLGSSVNMYKNASQVLQKPTQSPLDSLAEVGSKIAMSFAFTFLRRAWRTSEDSELCTEILQDTLFAFRALPIASMYETSNISQTWLTVMEKSKYFLKTVAHGELVSSNQGATKPSAGCIPITDQHLAINLLLEFVLQTGKLSSMLEILLFLLNLWEERKQQPDIRKNPQLISGPVLHFVKQMKRLSAEFISSVCGKKFSPQCYTKRQDYVEDPVDFFLNSLHYPEGDDICINYQQAVVVALSFLNRTVRSLLCPTPHNTPKLKSKNIFGKKFSNMACYKVFKASQSGGISYLPELSDRKFNQIVCGKQFNAAISSDGTLFVFGCFESWSKAGLKNASDDLPLKVQSFEDLNVKFTKVAANQDMSYFLALSTSGTAYFCGDISRAPFIEKSGQIFFAKPERIDEENPFESKVIDIACGQEYILCVTEEKCYSWFHFKRVLLDQHCKQNDLARTNTISKFSASPMDTMAAALIGDHQILCLTVDNGGKLKWNCILELWQAKLCKIHAGHTFVAAITEGGDLYVWGDDINGLVGSSEPLLGLTLVENVSNVKDITSTADQVTVIDIFGSVYYWNYGSVDGLKLVADLANKKISGISLGRHYRLLWGVDDTFNTELPSRLPFVLQPNEETLDLLNSFLTKLCSNLETTQVPNQERECMIISVVNLLHLQLQESILRTSSENGNVKLLNSQSGWTCLSTIKNSVIYLASTPGITASIRISAQKCLLVGWKILLPSIKERACALAQVLESTNKSEKPHEAQVFLINLLIESLVDDNAMEIMLKQEAKTCFSSSSADDCGDGIAKTGESVKQAENESVKSEMINLVSLILKKVCRETVDALRKEDEAGGFYHDAHTPKQMKTKASDQHALDFLTKFHSIVAAYALKRDHELMPGCSQLLKKYTLLLCEHATTIMKVACAILTDYNHGESSSHAEKEPLFLQVSENVDKDAGCIMLSPLITSLVLTDVEYKEENQVFCDVSKSQLVADFSCMKDLTKLLKALDRFNSFAPGAVEEDESATKWLRTDFQSKSEDLLHSTEDGADNPEKDATVVIPDCPCDTTDMVSGFTQAARSLAIFLSMHLLKYQKHKSAREKLEKIPSNVQTLLLNGLVEEIDSKTEDEIKEVVNTVPDHILISEPALAIKKFLLLLPIVDESSFRLKENEEIEFAASNFVRKFDHHCKKFGYISSGSNETKMPLEQFGRCYIACLLKHHNLADVAFTYALQKSALKNMKTPSCIVELCKIVTKAKLKIVQERQSSGKSYAEICYPLLERLNFLLTEVLPPPLEFMEMQKKQMLCPKSRWRTAFEILKRKNFQIVDEHNQNNDDSELMHEITKLKKIRKEAKNKNKKGVDYWKLLYSVITSKSAFENLKQHINGTVQIDGDVTNAVTEFVVNVDISVPVIRNIMLYCQSTVRNATLALEEILDVFHEEFFMPSTSFCLRIAWNSVFDLLCHSLGSKELEAFEKKKAEKEAQQKGHPYLLTVIKADDHDSLAIQRIPCNPILDFKYSLSRRKLGEWAIDKFRTMAIEALFMAKRREKYPDDTQNLNRTFKSSMVDQQVLLAQSMNLIVELHTLHFLWNLDESYMMQSMLSGCQAIFEKILTILKEFGIKEYYQCKQTEKSLPTTSSLACSDAKSKSEPSAKHTELETGPKLVRIMKRGTKVVRGRDWKWEDQDGKPPGEGCVLSSPEDGWVRVRWPTGVTNSYRMGKDDKYDVKLAQPQEYCGDDEEGHSCLEKVPTRSAIHNGIEMRDIPLFPLIALQRACSSALQMQLLTLATVKNLDEGAARIASKRLYSILNPQNNHPLVKEFSEEWASLQLIRVLAANDKFSQFFVTNCWIKLLQDIIGHDFLSVTSGNVQEQIQAIWLLGVLLPSTHIDNLNCQNDVVKYLFTTLGKLALGVKSIQDENDSRMENVLLKRISHLPGLSPYADHAGTIAEQISDFLRKLHSETQWKDIINHSICSYLHQIPSLMRWKYYDATQPPEETLAPAFGVMAMITQVDKRLRVGCKSSNTLERVTIGSTSFKAGVRKHGIMIMDIKEQENKVKGFFMENNNSHNSEVDATEWDCKPQPPNHDFKWEMLPWTDELISTCSELLKIVLTPSPDFESELEAKSNPKSGAKPKAATDFGSVPNPNEKKLQFCKFHLFIYLLRSLPILLQNQKLLRTVIKYTPEPTKATEIEEKGNDTICEDLSCETTPLFASCPDLTTLNPQCNLRRCSSEGDISSDMQRKSVVMLPLDNIKVHTGSAVIDTEQELDVEAPDDVTEATEEYRSEDETETPTSTYDMWKTDSLHDDQKNVLQELLSLAVTPSKLKPSFNIEEIEEAVSSLLSFLESSTSQQDNIQEYIEKLNIPTAVLESSDKYVKQDPAGNASQKENQSLLRRDRRKRRARQIEHVRANEDRQGYLNTTKYSNLYTASHNRGPGRLEYLVVLRSPDDPTVCTITPYDIISKDDCEEMTRLLTIQPSQEQTEDSSQKKHRMERLIPAENMQTLKDMGFKDKHIFTAYKELNKSPLFATQRDLAESGYVLDVEIVIAWLLENPFSTVDDSCDSDIEIDESLDGFTIIENDMFGQNQDLIPEDVFHGLDNNNKTSSSSDSESTDDDNIQLCSPLSTPRPDLCDDEDATVSCPSSYLGPQDFSSSNEYARYIRSNIKVGMLVKCCKSYEDVKKDDTGRVLKLDHDGLHDLNVHAAWALKGGTYWVRYVHVQLLRDESQTLSQDQLHLVLSPIAAGDMVRVKASVATPKYKWGFVRHESVGKVINIQGKDAVVNFKEQEKWTGLLSELEKVPEPHPSVSCDQCQALPIVGPRYKCTICFNYDMCSACFGKTRHASARHVFDMIEKPGAPKIRTTASFPSPSVLRQRSAPAAQDVAFCPSPAGPSRYSPPLKIFADADDEMDILAFSGTESAKSPKSTTSWKKLVEQLDSSSGEGSLTNLIDGNDDTFWKSAGQLGEHKLTLKMQPGAVVTSLVMQVDPDDSCYMPSLVNIVLSDAEKKSVKSRSITIQPKSKFVLLLRDCDKHYQRIVICIKKCQSFGIDCKIHGLLIKGYLKQTKRSSSASAMLEEKTDSNDDIIQQLFLSSESEEQNEAMSAPQMKHSRSGGVHTKVYVWGLNDKDQLGGPKGAKIKSPHFSETLSSLGCGVTQIAGGSKCLFIVTQEGKVFSCGESTSGRLGLGLVSSNVSIPTFVSTLSSYFVTKIAVHSGGRHAMVLTSTGVVFSWGDGEDGKLGHCNRTDCYKPRLIAALKDQRIVDIACGSSHSAAVTVTGKLYTWGQGNYGRLGHGDNTTHLKPKLVSALHGVHVTKVACGSRDAQTLCLSKTGQVFSWGDGDFGKLGRGGSDGCPTPQLIDRLDGQEIIQIECGAQFSLALSRSGKIWTWGKGDYFRLGHGHDNHVRYPHIIEELKHRKVVEVAVGALHCLAVTEDGTVFAWGDNDHGQQGNSSTTVNRKPGVVEVLEGLRITNVACGSSHSAAWSETDETQGIQYEPLRFLLMEDRCGQSYSTRLNTTQSGGYYRNNRKQPSTVDKKTEKKLSLAKMVLSVSCNKRKTSTFLTLIQSMRVNFGMELITRSLIPAKYTKDGNVSVKITSTEDTETKPATNTFVSGHLDDSAHQDLPGPSGMLEMDSTPSSSNSAAHSAKVKLSDHAMVSLIAETITKPEEITVATPRKITSAEEDSFLSDAPSEHTEVKNVNDDTVYSELGIRDAKSLADMLKFAVAGRTSLESYTATSHALRHLIKTHPEVMKLLLRHGALEIEQVTNHAESKVYKMRPVEQESTHPYADNCEVKGHVRIPGAKGLRIEFDPKCSTEARHDVLSLYTHGGKTMIAQLSGRLQSDWATIINAEGDEVTWNFKSDASVNGWGWKFTAYPVCSMGDISETELLEMSNQELLRKPVVAFVSHLFDIILPPQVPDFAIKEVKNLIEKKDDVFHQLFGTLTSCIQTNLISPDVKIWAIQRLQSFCMNFQQLSIPKKAVSSVFKSLIEGLYQKIIESGLTEFMPQFTEIAMELLNLASDIDLENVVHDVDERLKLAPFSMFFMVRRTMEALIHRKPMPAVFLQRVSQKLDDLHGDDFDQLVAYRPAHEDNSLFTQEMDEQLVNWMNSSPSIWNQSWGGSGQIYGWGHNHRGQLGGIEGAKVKVPTLCNTLIALQPVSLAGGEQTLYSITTDGKVYATGYGASGRLGIGSNDSIALPTLLESIRHVHITKVSVNSGGKHILALSIDGEVYSWGEGGDGKLGHGARTSCDRPRVIESLRGVEIIDICAGGAHSAAISKDGHLYTWGKGRYGRLGHGDSEDRLRPKMVEYLSNYRVLSVACGSGDAQTLCVTENTHRDKNAEVEGTIVWSWGDGDYGKLGRGGSEMSKIPTEVESLRDQHIVTVKCGSQFSLALSKSGLVYTWGKGDYYRLGHGSDQHVRYPKVIEDLIGKKVVDVSTGSLHCVVCTEDGEVYAWGDNDEGQIGDGTTQAAQRLTLIAALSGQGVDRVACGSAHSVAWSTGRVRSRRRASHSLPSSVPLKYNLLQAVPIPVLQNRLVLLNQFSELLCGCIPFLSLMDQSWRAPPSASLASDFTSNFDVIPISRRFPDAIRGLLFNSGKECFFRKVVQTTMVRDKQHGPSIELNRIEIKEIKKTGVPLNGLDFLKAVFPQAVAEMEKLLPESVLLPHRVWKVKFVGESVDDCGGGYSESIAEMCDELENGSVPLLTQTPNGRDEAGANRDCFLLLPPDEKNSLCFIMKRMFKFLGILIGIAIRTGSPLSLNLAEPLWKQLSGQDQCLTDISEVDKDFLPKLMFVRDADAEELESMNLPFAIQSASGESISLSKIHSFVTVNNRNEYIRQAIQYRLHEFDHYVNFVRDGIACVVPLPLISLFTANELETMVCGSPDIPLSLLKSVASFKGTSAGDDLQKWFWEIMESMTNEERSLFLRFVWGRTRLPRTIADFRGRDFVIQVLDKYHPPDYYLPESYTCFFLLKLPRYSSKAIMDEKLKYAIYFCKSIDTDDYARLPVAGDDDEEEDLEDLIAANNNNNSTQTSPDREFAQVQAVEAAVDRLSRVTTTSLSLLSRYSSNVSRYLSARSRRPPRIFTRAAYRQDLRANLEDDSSTSGPDSQSDSDNDSLRAL